MTIWRIEGKAWADAESFPDLCIKMSNWFQELSKLPEVPPEGPFVKGLIFIEPHPLSGPKDTVADLEMKCDQLEKRFAEDKKERQGWVGVAKDD